jgi:hypothetical protein
MNNSFFVQREDNKEPLKTISQIFRNHLHKVTGDVGLEFEFEGNKFPVPEQVYNEEIDEYEAEEGVEPDGWKYHKDHSLRGEDNAEYVLDGPKPFDAVEGYVRALFKELDDFGTVIDDSHRTSVHVHLNIQEKTIPQVATLVALYFCFEELLIAWCGDRRQGNLFCLSGRDAPGIVTDIRTFLKSTGGYARNIPRDNNHYAALNAHSIGVFGSLEFRSMRGVTNPEEALQWISMLRKLYEAVDLFDSPTEVCEMFSGYGPSAMLTKIFGTDLSSALVTGSGYSRADVDNAVHRGIRIAQDICFCRDWKKFSPPPEKDIFGRDINDPVELQNLVVESDPIPPPSPFPAFSVEGWAVGVHEIDELLNDIEGNPNAPQF